MTPYGDDARMPDSGIGLKNLLGSSRPPRTILSFLSIALLVIAGFAISIVAALSVAGGHSTPTCPDRDACGMLDLIPWVLLIAGGGIAVIVGVVLHSLWDEESRFARLMAREFGASAYETICSRSSHEKPLDRQDTRIDTTQALQTREE